MITLLLLACLIVAVVWLISRNRTLSAIILGIVGSTVITLYHVLNLQ